MACCVLAMLLLGQLIALLRRWGIFWGVVRPGAYEDGNNTAFAWVRARLARRRVRLGLAVLVAIEVGVFAPWLYVNHGAHIYRLADVAVSRLRGERVFYVGVCTPKSDDEFVRVVINRSGRA